MSNSFKTVLVKDPTLGDITDNLTVCVQSGASNKTYQQYSPQTASNSSIVFSCQIPSENIVISRDILLKATITFTIRITGVPVGSLAFELAKRDSLQCFPLNSLFTTVQSTINNCSVSSNLQDILPQLLRFNDTREMYRYNSTTASFPDCAYANYIDGVAANNNPMAGYSTSSFDIDQQPRGAWPVQVLDFYYESYDGAVIDDHTIQSTNVGDSWRIVCQTIVAEPLIGLSPFTYSHPEYNAQGLTGITSLSFNFNVDSTCKRFWSTASNAASYTVSLGSPTNPNGFSNMSMLFELLSPQSTDSIKAKNVVPMQSFPRYLTMSNTMTPIPSFGSSQIISQTIQLNQVPSLFVICIRKPMAQQTVQDSSSFFVIQNVSINFNNASGLLASAKQEDLFTMSCLQNGVNQSYAEWGGLAVRNSDTGQGLAVSTTGSILAINPALDLSLPPYLSCGSLGAFQFSCTLQVYNQFSTPIAPEIVILSINDGLFATELGSSTAFSGLLNKDLVLNTLTYQAENPISAQMYTEQIGGKMCHRTLAIHPRLARSLGAMTAPSVDESGGMSAPSTSGGMAGPSVSGGARGIRKHVR